MHRPTLGILPPLVLLTFLAIPGTAAGQQTSSPASRPFGAFVFRDSVQLSLPPSEAFDRFLEVDAWWDHRFSEDPVRFFIEAKPGGGFYEIFDEEGNGIRHATVIFASRGKSLRMRGPLGLSGYALDMVYNLEFESTQGGTLLKLEVRGAGELEAGWAKAVQSVWHHFLHERYRPYCQGTLG